MTEQELAGHAEMRGCYALRMPVVERGGRSFAAHGASDSRTKYQQFSSEESKVGGRGRDAQARPGL